MGEDGNMKKYIQQATVLGLVVVLSLGMSIPTYADWFQNNGVWYYNDENNQLVTDFQYINGKWYFFSTKEDESKGSLLMGIQWIGHKCYFLNPDDGGAVAINMDYGEYHFGSDGCAVNSINNPVLMGEVGYPTRVGINDKLMTYAEKAVSKVSEPSVADNAEYLKVFRENYPGSVIETMVNNGIKYQGKPYDRRLTSYIHMQMANNVRTKVELNVMSKLAGKEIPYSDAWDENSQYLYDWMIEFYKSYDWENASDYEKARQLYMYLGSKYKYGNVKGTMGHANEFEPASMLVYRLSSPQLVCEDFSLIYHLLGDSIGLDVGYCSITDDRLHIFNLINIDGEIYCADASGYAKYHKPDSYFGIFEDIFFYDRCNEGVWYEGEEIFGETVQ